MEMSKAVALRITNLLIEKKMTLYKLEQESGIWHGTMSYIMSGKNKTVTLTNTFKLAKGFNMSVLQFLNDPLFNEVDLDN